MSNRYEELVPHNAVKLIATDSTGDKLRYASAEKVRIRKVAVHVGATEATACVIKFDKRPTFGSDTSRGDGDMAVLNIPASDKAGKVIYVDLNDERVTLEPGEEMVAQVTTASTGDKAVQVEVLFDRVAEVDANLADTEASS